MKHAWTIIFALLLIGTVRPALAATSVKASMLLSGTITVTRDGHVSHYTLDKADKVPPSVTRLLAKAVPAWRFQPVVRDGKTVPAKAKMHLRIVATPAGHDTYTVTVGGARFGDGTPKKSIYITHRVAPRYPQWALTSHVSGTAYLLVRVNPQGHVDKIAAEEVDLMVSGTPAQMQRARKELANAAIHSISRWTFKPPEFAVKVGGGHWIASIPVNFRLQGVGIRTYTYGQWQPYVPGPRKKVPWNNTRALMQDNLNAMLGGGIYAAGQGGLHRITKPQG